MSYITKRADSGVWQFRMRVPEKVSGRLRGKLLLITFPPYGREEPFIVAPKIGDEVKFSLKTKDEKAAKARALVARDQIEKRFDASEIGPVKLSSKDMVNLSRDIYVLYRDTNEGEPGSPDVWAAYKGFNRAVAEGRISEAPPLVPGEPGSPDEAFARFGADLTAGIDVLPRSEPEGLERRFGLLADWLLSQHGLEVDGDTRLRLLSHVATAATDAGWRLKENAQHNYSLPDRRIERFGEPYKRPAAGVSTTATAASTLTGILEGWWTEAKAAGAKPATNESYSNTVKNLKAFLKHDDARRVSKDDVIAFKDHRLASINPRTKKPISAKTVKDSDLVGLKAVFKWAVANNRMTINPADGVTIKLRKSKRVRPKYFTPDEVKAILRHALKHTHGKEAPKTYAAKKWVPWLCAYSGARVGEMAQLRKEDIRKEGKSWVITITPDAGTVKTNEARDVVLHEHIVELGFPAFVASSRNGHLFVTPAKDGDVLGPLQGVKNRLQEFSRQVVTDPNVAPNHGWRHTFKTIGREAGIEAHTLDAIAGHSPRTEGENYGDVTVKTRADAMEKFPRYKLD